MINDKNYKNAERFLKKALKAVHVKRPLYRSLILPSQEVALHKLRNIVENTTIDNEAPKNKKILFHSLNARHMQLTYIEAMMAKALELRGYDVKMLICGGALSMCSGHHTIDTPFEQWSCDDCIKFSKRFYETVNLEYGTYWDYCPRFPDAGKKNYPMGKLDGLTVDECHSYNYKGVDVGYHSRTSAERYFKGDINDKSKYEIILKAELANAILAVDIAERLLVAEEPDILVTSHGCYSAWGSFLDYFRTKNVPSRYYMPGEGEQLTFDRHLSNEQYADFVKIKKSLADAERKELHNLLERRAAGTEGQTKIYGAKDKTLDELHKIFKYRDYDKTYVLYPNVPWDAALVGADKAFKNLFDWISTTVYAFEDHMDDCLLILKIHSSEVKVMQSKKTVYDYVKEFHASLPHNVYLLSPSSDINVYSLFKITSVGLVYNGTIGLEMISHSNIPVIVAGNAHYGRKGFTYDVDSKDRYLDILFKELPPLSKEKAEMYAYYFFLKTFIPNPLVYEKSFLNLGWRINSFDDFARGKNKYLDHICDYIVNNGTFQNW